MIDEHKISIMESLQKEKQIVVDPFSLKQSSMEQGHFETTTVLHLPPLKPPNPKFLSLNLPNSAISSPRFVSALSKKIPKGESQEPQFQASDLSQKNHNQHDVVEVHLRKSKSCDERRSLASLAPSYDELDQLLSQLSAMEHDKRHLNTFSKTEEAVKLSPKSVKKKHMETQDDGVRCNALCMYLPGLGLGGGKVRPIKARKEGSQRGNNVMIPRKISLEDFECGSWASSAAMFNEIEGESNNSYFDLPMELIKCSSANASFAFEKELRGVLKNGSSRGSAKKSPEALSPTRRVWFSASPSESSCPASPAFCISPRLRKAREDFNAFLAAAQSA